MFTQQQKKVEIKTICKCYPTKKTNYRRTRREIQLIHARRRETSNNDDQKSGVAFRFTFHKIVTLKLFSAQK